VPGLLKERHDLRIVVLGVVPRGLEEQESLDLEGIASRHPVDRQHEVDALPGVFGLQGVAERDGLQGLDDGLLKSGSKAPDFDLSLLDEAVTHLKVYRTSATDWFRIYKKDKKNIPSAGFATNNNISLFGKITRFIRGNFFIPDPRKGWNKFALRKACSLIESGGIRHIITTSPPHSTQLIGLKLKKRYPEITWIADLRDPWTDIYYYKEFYPTCLSYRIDSCYEKKVLKSAGKIITVGKSLGEIFSSKLPHLNEKIVIVSNGYDTDDFSGLKASLPGNFTISYIGTLSDKYPVAGLLRALKKFDENKRDFRLRFTGFVSSGQKESILSALSNSNVEFNPYADHSKAIKSMADSTVLLLIIPDHQSSKSIITGKLFEYLASGKPVICLGPVDGDAADILEESGHGKTFGYLDTRNIYEYLNFLYLNPAGTFKSAPAIYARENLVKRVVELLEQ